MALSRLGAAGRPGALSGQLVVSSLSKGASEGGTGWGPVSLAPGPCQAAPATGQPQEGPLYFHRATLSRRNWVFEED